MTERNKELKNKLRLIITLLFVYVLLFEFIIPFNKFLPKPSILAESVFHIIRDYNLIISISVTFTVFFAALIIAYFVMHLCSAYFIKWLKEYEGTFSTLKVFKYLPVFVVIILLNLWFVEKILWEFIFAVFTAFILSFSHIVEKIKDVKDEYVVVGKNLGLSEIDINEKIQWKYLQPILIQYYEKLVVYLWGIILVFEFVGNASGLGYAYRQALSYKDLNAIILFCIFLYILVWITAFIIKTIRRKYFNWAD